MDRERTAGAHGGSSDAPAGAVTTASFGPLAASAACGQVAAGPRRKPAAPDGRNLGSLVGVVAVSEFGSGGLYEPGVSVAPTSVSGPARADPLRCSDRLNAAQACCCAGADCSATAGLTDLPARRTAGRNTARDSDPRSRLDRTQRRPGRHRTSTDLGLCPQCGKRAQKPAFAAAGCGSSQHSRADSYRATNHDRARAGATRRDATSASADDLCG